MPPTLMNLDRLIAQFPRYQDPNRIRTDVLNVWRHRQSLSPKRGKLTLNTGVECDLLMLEGTFPIVYRGVEYYTPIEIYITENYPTTPPTCYIRPTSGMSLKVGHRHVDQTGLVYLPYLHEWTARTHNLVELIANMSSVFGAEPPLFATPPGGVRPSSNRSSPQPQHQPSHARPNSNPYLASYPLGAAGTASSPYGGYQNPRPVSAPAPALPPRPDPEIQRREKEAAVTAKLRSELQVMYSKLGADIDSGLETQAQLNEHQEELDEAVEELSRRKKELERLIQVAKEREMELDTYLEERQKEGEPSVDDLIEPKDALSDQMLRLTAENAALEDALYYLDVGLTDSVITVDVFLKEIRRLARKQFVARATSKKVERAQQEVNAQRARFNAEQQENAAGRGGGGHYPHLPPQQQYRPPGGGGGGVGSAGYMAGPPPGYSPPSADYRGSLGGSNYLGAKGYGQQPAAGTAGPWSGGGGAAGMGYGYPSFGGAKTSNTQRR